MRFAALLVLVLPLLAACESSTPPATTPAKTPAATAPAVKAPVVGKIPAGAVPLVGTWAADLAQCGNANATTIITATSYTSAGKSCDISFAANKDGSFTATCGSQKIGMTPIFAPSGEGVHLVVGDKKSTVYRCTR